MKMSDSGIIVNNDNNKLVLNCAYKNLVLTRVLRWGDLPVYKKENDLYNLLFNYIGSRVQKRIKLNDNEILVAREINTRIKHKFKYNAADNYIGDGIEYLQIRAYTMANEKGYVRFAEEVRYRRYGNKNEQQGNGFEANGYEQAEIDKAIPTIDDLKLYVFGFVNSDDAGKQGMVLYNENGEVVFNSNNKYMRVISNLSDTSNHDFSVSKRTYASVDSSVNLPDWYRAGWNDSAPLVDAQFCTYISSTMYDEKSDYVIITPEIGNVRFNRINTFKPGLAVSMWGASQISKGCFLLDVTGY